jgi:CheY-like chemotaxis protein
MNNPTVALTYDLVMVVDDNETDRYIAEMMISRNNFARTVVVADCAREALTYLEQNLGKPGNLPQIIFLDINMPELNGFDFLERYDAFPDDLKKNCRIVMLTSSLDGKDHALANKDPHVAMFLNKPLNREKLEKVLLEQPAMVST